MVHGRIAEGIVAVIIVLGIAAANIAALAKLQRIFFCDFTLLFLNAAISRYFCR